MNKREIGAEYEAVAASYLENQGMVLLHNNFRCRQGEVDLVGLHQGCLVFVEVKYRKNEACGTPEGAVGSLKQARICRTSDFFRTRFPQYGNLQVRYDVIAVCGEKIKWYQNAFSYIPHDFEKQFSHRNRNTGW